MASKQMPVEFNFSIMNPVGRLELNAEMVALFEKNPNYHIAFSHIRNDDGTIELMGASIVDNNNFVKDVKNKDL